MMAMNKKSKRRIVAMQRILIAGILLFSVSLSVILMFRDRLSLLLVSNVQTELLDITRQNSMYVDGRQYRFCKGHCPLPYICVLPRA